MAGQTELRKRRPGAESESSRTEPDVPMEKESTSDKGESKQPASAPSSFKALTVCAGPRKEERLLSWQLVLLLSVGVAFRVLLYSVGLTLPESTEPLVSPSSSSFSSFREALTLQALSFSPYTGGVYRQQPLIFLALQWLTRAGQGEDENCDTSGCQWRYYIVLICIDLVAALALAAAAAEAHKWAVNFRRRGAEGSAPQPRTEEAESKQELPSKESLAERRRSEDSEAVIAPPALVAANYFLHPMTVGAILSLTIHTLPLACFALALACATRAGRCSRCLCVIFFGCTIYVGPPQALLLALPLAHLMHAVRTQTVQRPDLLEVLPSPKEDILPGVLRGLLILVAGVAFCASLHVASYLALRIYTPDAADYFDSTVVALWEVRDLGPNLGIFWYILSLIFERYRLLFVMIFQGHSFILVVPLFVRMFRYPLAYCQVIIAIALLFQPFFCIADSAFLLTLLITRWQVVKQKAAFVKMVVVTVVAASIYPVVTELWLGRNTGNPNFVYNIQTIFHIFVGFLVVEWIKGVILDKLFTSSQPAEQRAKTA